MKRFEKVESDQTIPLSGKKLIFFDFSFNEKWKKLLQDIQNRCYDDFQIIIIYDETYIYNEDHEGSLFYVKKYSSEYKTYLKKSEIIITNQTLPIYFIPGKKQKIYFIVSKDEEDYSLDCVQHTCRLSTYNIFPSSDYATHFLTHFHIFGVLKTTNIVYNIDNGYGLLVDDIIYDHLSHAPLINNINKKNIFIYVGKVSNKHQEKFIIEYLSQLSEDNHYYILLQDQKDHEWLENTSLDIDYIIYEKTKYTTQEKLLIRMVQLFPVLNKFLQSRLNQIFYKKVNKNLRGYAFQEVVLLLDTNRYACRELGVLSCPRRYIKIHPLYNGVNGLQKWYVSNQNYKHKNYDSSSIFNDYVIAEQEKETCLNSGVKFYRYMSFIKNKGDKYQFVFYLKCKTIIDFDTRKIDIYADEVRLKGQIKKGIFFYRLTFEIPKDELTNMPAQNKLYLVYHNQEGKGFQKDIEYTICRWKLNSYLKSKIINIDGKTSFYLRQSLKNRVYLTVRLHNKTDSFFENLKLNLAYYVAKLYNKKIYLLYEKDSSRYEESASVVYENLLDQGYQNAYFILDHSYQDLNKIPDQYKKNIIYKYSFKHYLYFFMSDTFLGSELMIHAIELRNMNKHVLQKVNSTDVNYVFLQHGVMYMISLDSESRKYFNPKKDGKGKFRVVTSSQKEADHFVQLGGYDPKQVIICGLPKYDRNIIYPEADSIVVMLTWRVWEYNQAMSDFQATPYYKMLQRIVNGIEKKYRDKLIILPHPLFYKAAQNNEFELKKYMQFNVKYDEILRNTRVLITDYSSIAYDAFYRGIRVIFYWEELTQCLEKYGPNTKLMLNKDNVFGDVCYSEIELKNVLSDNYLNKQKELYVQRYNKIVEFHDGQNTLRLIRQLNKEGIIK